MARRFGWCGWRGQAWQVWSVAGGGLLLALVSCGNDEAGDGARGSEAGENAAGGAEDEPAGGGGAAGGAGGADGAAGSATEGGATSAQPGRGVVGERCEPEAALACAAYAQRVRLECVDGRWQEAGRCAAGTLCDTSEERRGQCSDVVPECADRSGGDVVCRGRDRVQCGVDLVDTSLLEQCSMCRPEGCHCSPGTVVEAGAASGCAPCEPGSFSAEEDAAQCSSWTNCVPGQFVSAHGTTSSDRLCSVCPVGTLSTVMNAVGCTPGELVTRTNSDHSCMFSMNGELRCWGSGYAGQLGRGDGDGLQDIGDDETAASAGVVVVGAPLAQIAVGSAHTCALLTDGAVRCWGDGDALGYGSRGMLYAPPEENVDVGGPVIHLAAGGGHTCALLSAGTVRCWGDNGQGELGYGHTTAIGQDKQHLPSGAGDVDVGGPVAQLTAGEGHTCALLTDGRVRCWGYNGGALGYGHTRPIGDDEAPASAGDVDVGGSVAQLVAGGRFTCALLTTGRVRCWGENINGQLGYGHTRTIGDDETPASAGDVDVGGDVAQIAAGLFHVCALLSNGQVRCWGHGGGGRLGYVNLATIGDDEAPASAGDVDVGAPAVQVAVGRTHSCALLADANLRCWGLSGFGQLGYGEGIVMVGDNETPASVGNVPYR